MRRSVSREFNCFGRVGADCRLDALTRKDQNLGLFHALGKIMYNKRKFQMIYMAEADDQALGIQGKIKKIKRRLQLSNRFLRKMPSQPIYQLSLAVDP